MTPTPHCPPVPAARPSRLVILALVLFCLPILGVESQQADDGSPSPGQGRILITLHARESVHGDPPQLLFALVFNTQVEGDQTHREVRAPLPDGARMQDFALHQEPDTEPPTTRLVNDTDGSWAVAAWNQTGPLPESDIAMRLDATQDVDPAREIAVEWDRLPGTLTWVRIAVPATHYPDVPLDHELRREDSLAGLDVWNLTRPPSDRLSFTIRTVEPLEDPGLWAPPPTWSAPAVLLVLVALSSSLWYLGKRSEVRKGREQTALETESARSRE